MTGNDAHSPATGQHANDKQRLGPGQALSNALQPSCAKGKIRKLRARSYSFSRPAFGLESFRIRVVTRIAVHEKLAHVHIRAFRNYEPVHRAVSQGVPSDNPHWWVKAHCLSENHPRIRQPFEVADRKLPIGEDTVEFRLCLVHHCRMLGEKVPRPGQSGGGGFMASHEERENLISHFLVGHAFTRFAAQPHEHG